MKLVPAVLSGSAQQIGFPISRIRGSFQGCSVHSQEAIDMPTLRCFQFVCEAVKQCLHRQRQQSRCWTKAETGAARPKQSISSWLRFPPPRQSRVEISVSTFSFRRRVKSRPWSLAKRRGSRPIFKIRDTRRLRSPFTVCSMGGLPKNQSHFQSLPHTLCFCQPLFTLFPSNLSFAFLSSIKWHYLDRQGCWVPHCAV